MTRNFRLFFLLSALALGYFNADAQSMDYLRHNKIFYLCDFKKDCSGCYDCNMQKYTVRIKNRQERQITSVSYVYYSRTYNKILTKQARIIGDVIDYNQVGVLNMCLPDGLHWAISEIAYDDGSKESFVVKDRLTDFEQEADECDCNKRTTLPDPNIN